MIKINEEVCFGCGACVAYSPEGFEIVDGKAVLKNPKAKGIKEAIEYCPVNAISK